MFFKKQNIPWIQTTWVSNSRRFSKKINQDEHSHHVFLSHLQLKHHTGGFPPQVCSGSYNHCAVLVNLLLKPDHNKIGNESPVGKKLTNVTQKFFLSFTQNSSTDEVVLNPRNISRAYKSVVVVKNFLSILVYSIIFFY